MNGVGDLPTDGILNGQKEAQSKQGMMASPKKDKAGKKEKFALPAPALEGRSTAFHQLGFCINGRGSCSSLETVGAGNHSVEENPEGSQNIFVGPEHLIPIKRVSSAPHVGESSPSSSRGGSPLTEAPSDSDYSNTDDWPEDVASPEALHLPDSEVDARPDVDWGKLGFESGSVFEYISTSNNEAKEATKTTTKLEKNKLNADKSRPLGAFVPARAPRAATAVAVH